MKGLAERWSSEAKRFNCMSRRRVTISSLSLYLSLSNPLDDEGDLFGDLIGRVSSCSDRRPRRGSHRIFVSVGLQDSDGAFPRFFGSNRKVIFFFSFFNACDCLMFGLCSDRNISVYLLFIRFDLVYRWRRSSPRRLRSSRRRRPSSPRLGRSCLTVATDLFHGGSPLIEGFVDPRFKRKSRE
ncbi:hypothetical protein Bca4012_036335 [Brassica carinata]